MERETSTPPKTLNRKRRLGELIPSRLGFSLVFLFVFVLFLFFWFVCFSPESTPVRFVFSRGLPSFTGFFYWVGSCYYLAFMRLGSLYRVLLGFQSGFIEFSWVLPGFIEFQPSFTEFD